MKTKYCACLLAGLAICVLAAGLLAPPSASGAPAESVQKALEYLKGRQQSDGGFAEPGQSSSDVLTSWTVMAIKSAGEDPSSWRKSGKSPLDFLGGRASAWSKLTDIERGCMAAAAAGADPRSFGGRNLVAEISGRLASDGHIGDMVNEHVWGVIALEAAGEQLPDVARGWLAARQNIDGGFGFTQDVTSDPDDTGAALQALIAAGEPGQSNTVDRALKYLKFCQADDGGFCWQSLASNVASTAWAAQGIAASGQDPGSDKWRREGKTPLDYLVSMQQADGHVRYKKDSDSQPAWMTAEAIPALMKYPFPKGVQSTSDASEQAAVTAQTTEDQSPEPTAEGETMDPLVPEPAVTSTIPGDTSGGSGTADGSGSENQGETARASSGGGNMVAAQTKSNRGLAAVIIICVTLFAASVILYFGLRRALG